MNDLYQSQMIEENKQFEAPIELTKSEIYIPSRQSMTSMGSYLNKEKKVIKLNKREKSEVELLNRPSSAMFGEKKVI